MVYKLDLTDDEAKYVRAALKVHEERFPLAVYTAALRKAVEQLDRQLYPSSYVRPGR